MAQKEHVFQISMSFDEDMALKAARDQAAGRIFGEVEHAVKDKYHGYTYCSNAWREFAQEIILEQLDDILKQNKDALINLAAEKIAERTMKTKAFKEKVPG